MENLTPEQWAALMPAVAKELKGEPDEVRGDEWRWLGQGGFLVYPEKGTFTHFNATPGAIANGKIGGGCFDLVKYELNTDSAGAVAWLQERGFIAAPDKRGVGFNGRRGQRATPQRDRAREQQQAQQNAKRERERQREREGKKAYAVRLWNESKPIAGAKNPARLWASELKLLHPWVPFPPALRWHAKRGWVVAAFTPMASWRASWPSVADVCGVSVVAIDRQGKKRMAFGDGTRDKVSHGPLSSGVVAMGSPTSKRVVLVEGIKDMLAVYSHYPEPCAVLATITTLRGCLSRPGLVDYLRGREVELWTDTDAPKTDKQGVTRRAGQSAGYTVQAEFQARGIPSTLHFSNAEGDDPGDFAQAQEWPEIDRGEFDEAVRGGRDEWPECEAARRAIHASVACTIQSPFHELTAMETEQHIAEIAKPWPPRPRLGDPPTLQEAIMGGLRH